VRQNASSFYVWNETIVESTSASGKTEGWLSYVGQPGIDWPDGVVAYSRVLKEVDDVMAVDREAWEQIVVPGTEALQLVEGEPVV